MKLDPNDTLRPEEDDPVFHPDLVEDEESTPLIPSPLMAVGLILAVTLLVIFIGLPILISLFGGKQADTDTANPNPTAGISIPSTMRPDPLEISVGMTDGFNPDQIKPSSEDGFMDWICIHDCTIDSQSWSGFHIVGSDIDATFETGYETTIDPSLKYDVAGFLYKDGDRWKLMSATVYDQGYLKDFIPFWELDAYTIEWWVSSYERMENLVTVYQDRIVTIKHVDGAKLSEVREGLFALSFNDESTIEVQMVYNREPVIYDSFSIHGNLQIDDDGVARIYEAEIYDAVSAEELKIVDGTNPLTFAYNEGEVITFTSTTGLASSGGDESGQYYINTAGMWVYLEEPLEFNKLDLYQHGDLIVVTGRVELECNSYSVSGSIVDASIDIIKLDQEPLGPKEMIYECRSMSVDNPSDLRQELYGIGCCFNQKLTDIDTYNQTAKMGDVLVKFADMRTVYMVQNPSTGWHTYYRDVSARVDGSMMYDMYGIVIEDDNGNLILDNAYAYVYYNGYGDGYIIQRDGTPFPMELMSHRLEEVD